MKIKYLKIRNIASIEKADIDFENDLQNRFENTPAPLFLISGDTGSGKSVILDCISMALYGTTPRVKGVANRTNNSFYSADGNEIKIHDISQYTRLGISSKDECFSELTFEGNDGITYISRFSLGLVRTGNFRPVAWRLQVGKDEVIEGNKKEEIKRRIVTAVGLSYEQFCRMAMLAQGQFADFLTGAKDERERILEQLTSTQHFSRYGQAIERIFKRAKQQKEEVEKIIETEKSHLLNPDDERSEIEKLSLLEKDVLSLRKEKDEIEKIISLLSNLEMRREESMKTEKELEALKAKESSDDFKIKTDILQKWDSTASERALLIKRNELKDSLNLNIRNYLEHLNSFFLLSDNLTGWEKYLSDKKKDYTELKEQLKPHEPYKEIYDCILLIKEKFNQRQILLSDLELKNRDLNSERTATEPLRAQLEKAIAIAEEASTALKREKEKIESLNNERNNLNPESTVNNLNKANEKKNKLLHLSSALEIAEDHAENLDRAISEKNRLAEEIENREKEAALAQSEMERCSKLYESALQRYNTMHLSVEENFNALRRRLALDNAQTCPLCGQSKEWHTADSELAETFSGILSPLEQERDKIHEESLKAEMRYKEIAKLYNQSTGMLKTQQLTEASLRKQFGKIINDLIRDLDNMGISYDIKLSLDQPKSFPFKEIRSDIQNITTTTDKEIAQLSEIKLKADSLQKEINLKIIECRPLEENVSLKEKERSLANTKVALNIEKISNLEKAVEEIKPKIIGTESEIDKLLKSHSKDWRDNPSAVILEITRQTETYLDLLNNEKKLADEISDCSKTIASLKTIQTEINTLAESLSDIPLGKEMERDHTYIKYISGKPLDELGKDWRDLLSEIKSGNINIKRERAAISETESKLSEYYNESSTTEEALSALIKLEMSIPAIRSSVNELTASISSKTESLVSSQAAIKKLISQLMEKTGAESEEYFPLLTDMELHREEVAGKLEEALRESGTTRERLLQNKRNKEKVAAFLQSLEEKQQKYEEWNRLNRHFGGTRFRTLVQSYILKPLLRNANIYLSRITDHFTLTCSEENEQLSILVLDRYNKNQLRSATVLSGGERFMISLALSLALSAMNKPGLNIDILFIDEGFGTLDSGSLNAVIDTLRRLPEIAGQNGRRVGVISHREELADNIDVQIKVNKCGEGRSRVEIVSGND